MKNKLRNIKYATFLFIYFIGFNLLTFAQKAEDLSGPEISIIGQDIKSQNDHNLQLFLSLRLSGSETSEDQKNYSLLSADILFGRIQSVKLVDIKIIPLDTAGQLINLDFYRSRFQNIIVFYAAVDYKVSNEDKYITNGTNYRLYVIVKQNDGYFIVEVSTAPLPIIKKLGIGFNTENEKKRLELNSQQLSLNKVSPSYVQSNTIRVHINSTNSILTLNFTDYIKDVLPNEWIPSWTSNALQSGALAVKMYGWWRVLNPRNNLLGYDIEDNTLDQVYKQGSNVSSSNTAVDLVTTIGFSQTDGTLFKVQYWNGVSQVYNTGGVGLKVYSTPSTTGTIVTTLNDGDRLMIVSSGLITDGTYRWWRVKTGKSSNWESGYEGYAVGNYIQSYPGLESVNNLAGQITQYGTQFLGEQGQTYAQIIPYYYNGSSIAGGQNIQFFTITPPATASITNIAVSPITTSPGSTVTLTYTINSTGSMTVLLGASFTLTGTSAWNVSDPTNDRSVSLVSGTQTVTRNFIIPNPISVGVYDLLVALWIDNNGNNKIDGKPIDSLVCKLPSNSALTISLATPVIAVSTGSLSDFGNVVVGQNSTSQSYTVSGSNLTANIAIQAPTGFQVSLNNSSFSSSLTLTPSSGTVSSTTIYARFSPGVTGYQTGNITHISSGATTRNVSISGTGTAASTPVIAVSTGSLSDFGNVVVGQNSTSQSYTVSGSNLTANIAIQAPTGFQVSLNNSSFSSSLTLTPSSGTVSSTTIYARFSPGVTGYQTGNITHISSGATTRNVSISGTGTAASTPVIAVSTGSLSDFGNVVVGQNSTSQSYTVSGSNLTANIAIQAPTGFQVSLNNSSFSSSLTLTPSSGTVSSTTIYARFSPGVTGYQTGNITHISSGATTRNVSISGTGTAASTPVIAVSTGSLSDFGNVVVGQNSTSQSYTVSGSNLTANIAIQAPTGFQVSLSSTSGFASSLNLTQSGGKVSNTTIYARFSPTSAGFQSGNISHTSTGATIVNISISGAGIQSTTGGVWDVVGTITLSGTDYVRHIAISGGKAYVTRSGANMTIIDLNSVTELAPVSFSTYPSCSQGYVAVSGNRAYVALSNLGSNGQLAVVNIDNNSVLTYIPVGVDPWGVTTYSNQIYVANNNHWTNGDPATVRVIDMNTNSVVDTILVGINPNCIAIDPTTGRAFVTNGNSLSNSVSVINTATNNVIATISVPNQPFGVAISANCAYVSNYVDSPNGTVEVIDISSNTIIASIPVGRDAIGVAAISGYVFVANSSSNTVSVIDVTSNTVVTTINVGNGPDGIAVDQTTNKVYVTNQNDKTISIIGRSVTSVKQISQLMPDHFALSQNYPNPMNPSTTISFNLPVKSFVSLKVFDMLGREVASIISQELPAGTYARQWNAGKMSSGVYFYRLQAGSFTQTKRLVLLK